MSGAHEDGSASVRPAGVLVTWSPDEPAAEGEAMALARRLALKCAKPPVGDTRRSSRTETSAADLWLIVRNGGLTLAESPSGRGASLRIDFLRGAMRSRLRRAPAERQLLARAVGWKGPGLTVLDATAGVGSDAFLLAWLGCQVTAVERSAVLGALLEDGVRRAAREGDDRYREAVDRLDLITADAVSVLNGLADGKRPEVVYVDPMYPDSGRSAKSRKAMELSRRVVGDDADAGEVFRVARQVARRRVVVKRRARAAPLAEGATMCLAGRTIRYDVYVVHEEAMGLKRDGGNEG